MSGAAIEAESPGVPLKRASLAEAQRSALKKAAWRFLPILTLAYVFNYLDRTAIGFAALQMNHDLGLSNTDFGLAAGYFSLTYTLCEVPSNLALYRFGARIWIARIMITWGIVSAAMAFVTSAESLDWTRLLLGVAEAGFFPGIAFFLSAWFPREYRARVLAWFLIGIPGSSLIGGPLCGLLLQLDGVFGISGWKWLFVMVSLPCIVMGFFVLKLLSDRPEEATWLTREEKDALMGMLASETHDRPKASVIGALTDPRVLILAFVQFGFTLGSYGIGLWLPLILKEFRLSDLTIGFLTFIPYLFAILGMLAWAEYADRTGKKIDNLSAACVLGAIGLGVYMFAGSLSLSLLCITLALIGVTAARGIFWSIPPRILTGVGAAGGIAFINTIGTAGGFFGPYMMGVLRDQTGGFGRGILAMAVIMLVTALLAASLKLAVKHE
jgi:ACS family tartrate transporter-like MFS transporter